MVVESTDSSKKKNIEKLDQRCYLIRNALDQEDQTKVFQEILDQCRHTDNNNTQTKQPCMNPSPKTIIFDGNQSTLHFDLVESNNVFTQFIRTIKQILFQFDTTTTTMKNEMEQCHHLTLGAIRYVAPNGSFPDHVDHRNNSFVVLLSLGCTANFAVSEEVFRLDSGDVLIFDASTKANLKHGVRSIVPESCPMDLAKRFPILETHRFGIQYRVKKQ